MTVRTSAASMTASLRQMETLLRSHGHAPEAHSMADLAVEAQSLRTRGELSEFARFVLRFGGGMGSLSDLVLMDGPGPSSDQEAFDAARTQLFQLAQECL